MNHIYDQPQFGENWFNYSNLYSSFVNVCPNNGHIVEVGSWKGKSSVYMAVEIINANKTIKFDCVDTWLGSASESSHQQDTYVKNDKLYDLFISNIEPVKHIINPIRKTSKEAALLYPDESLDIVFIDADHSYESVVQDIELWLPKVKIGGILAGHDYGNGYHPGVKQAVDEKLNHIHIKDDTCWVYHKQ